MVAANRKSVSALDREPAVPAATFKSSLRRWQAEYKARQADPSAATVARMTAELLLGPATAEGEVRKSQ
jgi:hypothetical protein